MSKKQLTILITAVVVLAVVGGGVVWYVTRPSLQPGGQENNNESVVGGDSLEEDLEGDELQGGVAEQNADLESNINDKQIYRNEELGIEIIYPAYVDADYSANRCFVGKINDAVPLKIFVDLGNNALYVRPAYYYIKDLNGSCKKVEETLEGIKIEERKTSSLAIWRIDFIDNIKNDDDLEKFLQNRYGAGCTLGKKQLLNNFTYGVGILGDGKDLGTTECPLNFWTEVRYSPSQKKIAAWNLGQDCSFVFDSGKDGLDVGTDSNPPYKDCIDSKIEIKFVR